MGGARWAAARWAAACGARRPWRRPTPGLGGWEPGRGDPAPRDGGACAVFWDLAGCRPAGPDSGAARSGASRRSTGASTSLLAYGDRASVHGGVRAGLQNSGVQLVDTGAHSNDRSPILIDMFDYALGRPAPATVVSS
ncbi:hypothetical protein SO694_00026134 [Aureococcus anophagefferens]|uniref:Uncharacterized protein n=1 Tax=Aureococcus anophagefferens TaxID=44056 RepID=A0ABR1FUB6_AURAN